MKHRVRPDWIRRAKLWRDIKFKKATRQLETGVPDQETIDLLRSIPDKPGNTSRPRPGQSSGLAASPEDNAAESNKGRIQWNVLPAGTFSPHGDTCKTLPSAIYKGVYIEHEALCLRQLNLISDELIDLPDSANLAVLKDIQYFWDAQDKFIQYGQLFKRGVLLFGPAGSGKTSTMVLVARDVVARGGVVLIHWGNPNTTTQCLSMIRAIEPERPIVCIFEDVEEITRTYGDTELLSILDGENQVGNVVCLATTNFPEELGARFLKRPGRFDEVIRIGMPSKDMRRKYLVNLLAETKGIDIEKWVAETEGMSLAFLRELVVGVCCLGKPFNVIMEKLKIMAVKPKPIHEYTKEVGFNGPISTAAVL